MELTTLQGILVALAVYGVVGYANQYAAENQPRRYELDAKPLYDVGHNIIPVIPKKYADILAIGLVAYFVIRWGFKYPKTLENYLWMITMLFIGRVIVFSVTKFPPPRPGCTAKNSNDKLHYRLFKDWKQQCNDLLYSGHTIHTVLVLLFVLYLSKSSIEKSVIFVLVLIELVFIIGSRIHYSCDVFVATLVTILIFYAWTGVDNIVKNITEGGIYGLALKQTHIK